MPEREGYALEFKAADKSGEKLELEAGEHLALTLVGTGKVGEYSLGIKPRQTAGLGYLRDRACVRHAVTERKSETAHACIRLDVNAHLHAALHGFLGEAAGIFDIEHRLRDVIHRKGGGIFSGGVAENEYRAVGVRRAHLHGLLEIRHGEPAAAALGEFPDGILDPVAVGVRLDHGDYIAAGRQGILYLVVIMPQGIEADLDPRPPEIFFHFNAFRAYQIISLNSTTLFSLPDSNIASTSFRSLRC